MTWSADDIKSTGESRQLFFRDALKRYELARTDGKRDQREASHECRFCFYFGHGMAGQAFTEYTCKGCDTEQMHSNTAVPKLCESCAIGMDACRRCGGPLEWPSSDKHEIRKPRLFPYKFESGPGFVVYNNSWFGEDRIGTIGKHAGETSWWWQLDAVGKKPVAGHAETKDQAITRLVLASVGMPVHDKGGRRA